VNWWWCREEGIVSLTSKGEAYHPRVRVFEGHSALGVVPFKISRSNPKNLESGA
jgi:hypothetical protein